jgi:predicted TIM-barrel fold metal-dependent hydrolase
MRKVIDIHAHLGDLLHNPRSVIWKLGVEHADFPNPFQKLEDADFNAPLLANADELPILYDATYKILGENTLENFTRKLNSENITYVVLYPVQPNTNFEEYLAASYFEPRILCFTAAEFTWPIPEMTAKLEQDITRGAKGMKVHPIVQNISLDDPRLHAAVEVFGKRKMPVIFHCGVNDYYHEDNPAPRTPEYGNVKYFIEFASQYQDFVFIAGHAGGLMGGEMEYLHDNWNKLGDHVYVDTTFRSSGDIRKMVDYFGVDRVLYGTDFPFSNYPGSVKQVEDAFPDNPEIREKIFYKNAARILKINV